MNPERTSKWNDSRLDAEFASVRDELHELRPLPGKVEVLVDELRAVRDLPLRLAEIAVEFRGLREDIGHCFDSIRGVDAKLAKSEDLRQSREEEQRIERKTDRRWMVGSALTAAGLVIAALALLGLH